MLSTLRFTAALAFGSSLLQVAKGAQQVSPPMEECDLPWAEEWTSGRSTATTEWCASQVSKLQIITGIKVWNSRSHKPTYMEGMQIWYANGDYTIVGNTPEGVHTREMFLDPWKEDFTSIELLPKSLGWDQNLYGVRFTSSKGQQIYGGSEDDGICPGCINWKDHGQTPIHGNLVGMKGKTGNHGIESITFYYLNAGTKGSVVHDLEFHPSPEELNAKPTDSDKGIAIETIQEGYSVNHLDDEKVTFHLSDTYHAKDVQSWTDISSNSGGIGGEFGLENTYDLVLVKEAFSSKFNWHYEHSQEHQDFNGHENWTDIAFTLDVPVGPKKAVHLWAYIMMGDLDIEWTAQHTITFDNDKTFTLPISGHFKRISYSTAWFHVEPAEYHEAVAAIEDGKLAIGPDGKEIQGDSLEEFKQKIKAGAPSPPSRVMRGV